MFKRAALAATASCALALAGCGGSNQPNQTMNRVLRTVPKPPLTFALAPVQARGVDFAFSCPSPAGFQFGASYLSDSAKDWTRACVARWPHRVLVWETTGTTPLGGFNAGASDARAASAEARTLGQPATRPIYFAIDFDATPGNQSVINAYFRGVASIIGLARTGAYGGYWPISRLFNAHLITYGWQTYAWSGGNWDPRAQLEQYQNGSRVDYDRAVTSDYGQWPYTPPKPKPTPEPKPKPKPTYNQEFDSGFQRGFTVRWDQRHHIRVPAARHLIFGPGFNPGYQAGWLAAR